MNAYEMPRNMSIGEGIRDVSVGVGTGFYRLKVVFHARRLTENFKKSLKTPKKLTVCYISAGGSDCAA